jgi:hypothetical protein
MWLFIVLVFMQAALATGASTRVHVSDSLEATGGYMALPLHRKQIPSPLTKRQSSAPIYTENLGLAYFIDGECIASWEFLNLTMWIVSIGNNNQAIPLMLDTGSPVTWVNADCSKMPDEHAREKADCSAQPRYDPLRSSPAHIQNQSFNITYGTGSVLGPYFTDDIRIGSAVVKNAIFGVAIASMDLKGGVFGIGARPKGFPPTVIDTKKYKNLTKGPSRQHAVL